MKKVVISSDKAPKATGPFSQAILTAGKYRLELGGQIGLDSKTSKLVEGGLASQTQKTISNIKNVLNELGWTVNNITKTRVFLTKMSDYSELNEIYAEEFVDRPPARVVVAVKELPLGALVEIDCIAEGDEISEEAEIKYSI